MKQHKWYEKINPDTIVFIFMMILTMCFGIETVKETLPDEESKCINHKIYVKTKSQVEPYWILSSQADCLSNEEVK